MKNSPTGGDLKTKKGDGLLTFEETQEHLDFSGEEISGRIFAYLQEGGRIDDLKVMKFQKLIAEKGKEYTDQYMKKIAKETSARLNDHGFPLQKRKDVVKLMREGNKLNDILGIITYNELKEYVLKSFTDFLTQSETEAEAGADQYNDLAKKRNEQQAFQKRMSEFFAKHMDDLLKISNSGAITILLSNNDSMTKTELLDDLAKKQGKKRDKADKDISKMIEGGMIREEGGKLSLIY